MGEEPTSRVKGSLLCPARGFSPYAIFRRGLRRKYTTGRQPPCRRRQRPCSSSQLAAPFARRDAARILLNE